jgi:hypothetical protein
MENVDRVGVRDRVITIFVCLDKSCEHVELVSLRRTFRHSPKAFDLAQGRLVIVVIANRTDVHVFFSPLTTGCPCPRPSRFPINAGERDGVRGRLCEER